MSDDTALQTKVERLRNIALFHELRDDLEAMTKIGQLFRTVRFATGRIVFAEGEQGDDLYVMNSGRVRIEKRTIRGDAYTVAELSAESNVFFGEVGLLDSDLRSATVSCLTDCELFSLSREDFIRLGDQNPRLGLSITRELTRIVCRHLRKANGDIITLFDALVVEMEESGGISEHDRTT